MAKRRIYRWGQSNPVLAAGVQAIQAKQPPVYGSGNPAQPQPWSPTPYPVVQTPPPDPYLEASRVSARRNVALADANATYQTQAIKSDYGLDPAFANNPYSQASQLEESYKRAQRGAMNSYAGQGQLNSGAYQRAQDETTRGYGLGYYGLRKGYDQALNSVLQNQLNSYGSNSLGVDDATFQALLKRLTGGS